MMSSKLTRNLSTEDKKRIEDSYKHFQFVFGRLAEILREESKALDKEFTLPPKNVEQWAWQQAYLRGEQAAYQRLISLLESE